MWILAIIFLFVVLFGFSSYSQDSDYIPFFLEGLDVWVHDNDAGNDYTEAA
jgi:hypothetical protein